MPHEFTIHSSPTYRSLETVLPPAEGLREQQRALIQRRAETLRAMGGELQEAMARGHDGCVMRLANSWKVRALEQAGYQVRPMERQGADAVFVYFGERDAQEKAALLQTMGRADVQPLVTPAPYRAPSPPSPSIYARSTYAPPSPPLPPVPLAAPLSRPPFDRGHTVPGPEYRARTDRTVAFDEDVRGGNYTPAPGRRF